MELKENKLDNIIENNNMENNNKLSSFLRDFNQIVIEFGTIVYPLFYFIIAFFLMAQ